MNTKIVYVLVSSAGDCYLEQTLISVYSCRLHNIDAHISIVLDRDTNKSLVGSRATVKKYATDIIVTDTPDSFNNMQKSRFLKTNLRRIIDGDFLYVDSDTVIADNLDEIDSIQYDLAAVLDSNRSLPISNSGYTSDSYIISNTEKLGWPSIIGYPNYNGGVLFVRDSSISHAFYSKWNELWNESVSLGMNIDMPALCRANIELGCCINELNGIWNCQIQRQGLPLLPSAKIIHCFTGGNLTFYELCSERILNKIKLSGTIDKEIDELIKNARTAFSKSTKIVSSEEAKLLDYPIIKLFHCKPALFKLFNKIAAGIIRFSL